LLQLLEAVQFLLTNGFRTLQQAIQEELQFQVPIGFLIILLVPLLEHIIIIAWLPIHWVAQLHRMFLQWLSLRSPREIFLMLQQVIVTQAEYKL